MTLKWFAADPFDVLNLNLTRTKSAAIKVHKFLWESNSYARNLAARTSVWQFSGLAAPGSQMLSKRLYSELRHMLALPRNLDLQGLRVVLLLPDASCRSPCRIWHACLQHQIPQLLFTALHPLQQQHLQHQHQHQHQHKRHPAPDPQALLSSPQETTTNLS